MAYLDKAMKKMKGSTLIEVIIVLAIFSLLMAISFNFSAFKYIMNNITIRSVENDISNLLSFAKQYCYANENTGKIVISKTNSNMSFIDTDSNLNRKVLAIVTLPEGYSFLESFDLVISNKGVISADTIIVKDLNGKYHKITISVGVDLISIY